MKSIFFHAPFNEVMNNLPLLKTHPVNLEVYFNTAAIESGSRKELEQLKSLVSQNHLLLRLHAPVTDLIPGSIEPRIRAVAERRYLQTVAIAKQIDVPAIVFHSGFHPILHKTSVNAYLENASKVFSVIAQAAAQHAIEVVLENVFENDPNFFLQIIQNVACDNFMVCFDIAHQTVFGGGTFESWIGLLHDWISEIHLSDNDTKEDLHLPPGRGCIPFDRLYHCLDDFGLHPIITFEPSSLEGFQSCMEYIGTHPFFKDRT